MQLLAKTLPAAASTAGLVITVLVAAWADLKSWRIPNQLLAPSAAAALMLSAFAPGGQGIAAALLGGVAGLLIFMPLYLLKGMAAGDVKLMSVIGLYSGWALTLDIALLTALIGGAWVALMLRLETRGAPAIPRWMGVCLRHRSRNGARKTGKRAGQNKSLLIPYGPVIATGTFLALTIARGG